MKYKDIEIEQDLKHERTSWKVQKIAHIGFIIILFLALLGLAGSGPLSRTELVQNGTRIKFSSITRFSHPEELIIESSIEDSLIIMLDKEFVKKISLKGIVPEPDIQTYNGQNIVFIFTSLTAEKPLVTIEYEFRESGNISGTLIVNKQNFDFSTFVWP